jgi:hypothetical protein
VGDKKRWGVMRKTNLTQSRKGEEEESLTQNLVMLMPFGDSNVCEGENEESPAALVLFERFSPFIWTFAA